MACVLQFHQISSKSDEKQKSFINSPFFSSEFQSVGRIVKIVHSAGPSSMEKQQKFVWHLENTNRCLQFRTTQGTVVTYHHRSNLLTWHVDLKLPGGMYSQDPSCFTVTKVLKALLNSAEAELNIKISAIQILIER